MNIQLKNIQWTRNIRSTENILGTNYFGYSGYLNKSIFCIPGTNDFLFQNVHFEKKLNQSKGNLLLNHKNKITNFHDTLKKKP